MRNSWNTKRNGRRTEPLPSLYDDQSSLESLVAYMNAMTSAAVFGSLCLWTGLDAKGKAPLNTGFAFLSKVMLSAGWREYCVLLWSLNL